MIVKGGDQIWIAVLPASEVVDEKLLARVLGVPSVRLLDEEEFERFFPGCEPGAEPPLGSLFGLPLVIDSTLAEAGRIVFRAGSHEEAIEIRYEDFRRLERDPKTGPSAALRPAHRAYGTSGRDRASAETAACRINVITSTFRQGTPLKVAWRVTVVAVFVRDGSVASRVPTKP